MEISKIFIWAAKIAFWGATALLAIGVYAARSPWWLIGFGLLLLVSFRALALCRIPLSTVFPLFLCNIYFIVAFFKIVLDNNASAWWLIVALLLEVIIVGNAQNQVEEDEKKSKLAEETGKRFAEEKRKATETVVSEDIIKENGRKRLQNSGDKKEDVFWEQKIKEHIRQLKSDENIVNRNIGDMLGLNYSDEDPVEGKWKEGNFLEIRDKFFYYFGESILKLATEENIPVKSNKLTGLYADTICRMAFQNAMCNEMIPKIFSLSLYIGTELAKEYIKKLSDFDKIPASELEKFKKEELKNKNEFPFICFYSTVKKYSSDLNGAGGTFASSYPDLLLQWCSDKKDECLSDYVLRNLDDYLQNTLPTNEDSDIGGKEIFEPDINALSAGLSPRHRIFSLAIAPNISEKSLKAAIRSYGKGVKCSEVLACINYNNKGKWEGIIITANALYSKSVSGDQSKIELTSQTVFRPEGKYIVVDGNNIGSFGMLNANSVSNFCRMMNNFISPGSGGDLEDESGDDGITAEEVISDKIFPDATPPHDDEEESDGLTETIKAIEDGDWKKVGKIIGKGIWNTIKETAEDTRRFRNEFENLSPYELAAICKNPWKSSAERAAAFHILKIKVPNEAERKRMLR